MEQNSLKQLQQKSLDLLLTLDEFCKENLPTAAILCIPKGDAKMIVDQLVRLGVKAFWNFTHYDIAVDTSDIIVENMHLGDSLMTLSYRLNNEE